MSRQMSLDKWLIQPRNSKDTNGSNDASEKDDQKDLNELKIAIETTIVDAEIEISEMLEETANAINKSYKTDDMKTRAKESLEMVATFAYTVTTSIRSDIETRIEEIAHFFDHKECLQSIEDKLLRAKQQVQAKIVVIRTHFRI